MKKILFMAAAACLYAGSSANAADIAAPVYDWSGFYIGVFGQYAFGSADAQVIGGPQDSFDIDGWQGGGLAGYNYQMNNIVMGLEGDIAIPHVHGTSSAAVNIDNFDLSPTGHIRARLGYAVDNFMPFIAGGLSIADGDTRIPGAGDVSRTHYGWNIGGGVDWGVTQNIVVRAEYIFDDYSTERYNIGKNSYDVGASTSTVRAAVMWKF
jgi:outer membrane immunogenic protein